MSTATPSLVTTEELLDMPDDGVDRELIRGGLKERPMTKRNRFHAATEARVARVLDEWLDLASFNGQVFSGELGVILRRNPDTTVGIDVALFEETVVNEQSDETTLIEGIPVLAVEILSPSDKVEDIRNKVVEYLDVGVQVVWVVDPYFRTVQVHRSGKSPETFNSEQTLTEPEVLVGFEVSVLELFQRPAKTN
jgi:Uma2 family endonuclease